MASTEDQLISIDRVDDFPDKSTSNRTDRYSSKYFKHYTYGNPKKYIPESSKQSTSKSPVQSTSLFPKPVTSRNPKRFMSNYIDKSGFKYFKNYAFGNPKKYIPESTPTQSKSGSPEQSTSLCPKPVTCESPEKSLSNCTDKSASKPLEESAIGSPKQCISENLKQSTSRNSEQFISENLKKSMSDYTDKSAPKCFEMSTLGSPEITSRSLEQSTSRSPEKSLSECSVSSTPVTGANSIQWVVGYFEDENVYSVIPSNWLLNENGCWFSKWPNSSYKATIEARIMNASEPAKTWKYYAVQIIERYDTYDEAEKETFLCVPKTDQSNFGRGKRKKLSNIRQIDYFGDDSDDEKSETDTLTKSKVYLKNNTSIDQNLSSNVSSSFVTQNTKTSPNNRLTTDEKSVDKHNGPLALNKINKNSISNKNSTKHGNQDSTSFPGSVFSCIHRINEKLNRLDKLLHAGRMYEPKPKTLDHEFLSLFPMKEIKDILSIDSRIVNCSEFEEKFIYFITSFNCTEAKDFVKQILSKLFTNDLATNCTWFGFKGKFELKNLKIIKIMNDVSSTTIKGHSDAVFKLFVKEWFKHGKKRFNRELNRKSRIST